MVIIGSGAERPIADVMFTGYACYLVAQSADAQTYFVIQTRKQERLHESLSNIVPDTTPILVTRMAVGKVVVASCEVAINQDLKAVSGSEHIDPVFLFYWLLSDSKKIESLGTGSKVCK